MSQPTAPHLRVLGDFTLTVAASAVPVHPAGQRVLAYLAVRRTSVRRSALAGLLWGDGTGQRAGARLRSTLWRLPRPWDKPLVETGPGRLEIASHVSVDLWDTVDTAHQLTTTARTGFTADAVTVPSLDTDLLPDWADHWVLPEQENYRQLRLHAVEQLSAALVQKGRYAAALEAALAAVRADPLRESARRQVIAVHLAEGNRADALHEFHSYRRTLSRELGIPPSPAIRTLVRDLLGRPLEARSGGARPVVRRRSR